MNDSTRVTRRPRQAWPSAARTAAAVIAAAGLVLLAAACSSGSPSAGGSSSAGGSQTSQLLAFAGCMRSNGVPNFPDPHSSDKFPSWQQLGVSRSQYQAAMNACKHLLPNGGNAPNLAGLQQESTALLPFARCMRSRGVSNWPDPSMYTNPDGDTAVVFNFIGIQGLDFSGFDSPRVQRTVQQCSHLLPPSHGGPPFRIVRR